jgi:hypothetical protein
MMEIQDWRSRCFRLGRSVVIFCGLLYVVAWLRTPHLMPRHSFNELAIYIFGGLILSVAALILIVVGQGKLRWLFVASSMIEIILFYGFAAMAAQLFG